MKVLERTGREARRSSMAAAAASSSSIDGLPRRRERISNKRRRDEEGEGNTDEEDCKVEVNEEEENLLLSQMSSSAARRRNHKVVKVLKKDQPVKVVHEMIGVQVPRKARSGKRSYDNQSLQKQSLEARKKMKPIVIKNWPSKSSKSASGSVEEDIENEVAEVLFGLMKQSRSSKDSDSVKSSNSSMEGKDRYSSRDDSKTSISEQQNSHASDLERENVSKEISSVAEEVEVEGDKQPKMETCLPNSEAKSEGVLGSTEFQKEETNPLVEVSVGGEVLKHESKRENKFEFDLMAPPPMEDSVSDKFEEEALFEKMQDKKTDAIKENLNENSDQDSDTKSQQKPKTILPKAERTDWRSGLTATTLKPVNSSLSQPSSKRCATHLYIARNIYLHQKVTKMNNFLPAAGSAPICDTKQEVVSRNPTQGSFLSHKGKQSKDKASVNANFIETSESKKGKVLRSPSQPASAANLMNEPTFKIPPVKNQSSVAATNNSSGVSRYTDSAKNASQLGHSVLPMVASANLSTSNVTFQEGPYVAINGYSFPISTPSGTTLTFEGGNSAQAVHLYNGPFYSSQMSYPSQLHQQHTHSQYPHQIQSSHQKNAGVSSNSASSSSSQRQLDSQQQRRTQSTSMRLQQSQKKHLLQPLQPCKIGNETNGGSTPSSSHAQHSVYGYGQNFTMSLQPMNFTMMPYVTLNGGGTANHSEKSQQEDLKDVIGMSFASLGGNKGTGTLLSFSSMAQNPATYQSLPATQGAQQKNPQVSERKTGIGSGNPDYDGLNATSGKSSTVVQTLVFDNNVNFTAPNSQQQQFFQFQLKQQQSMQQQQPALVARSKTPKNPSVFSQALLQCNTSVQSPKNSGRSTTSQGSITTSTVSSFIQQGRPQTQISFGANPKSTLAVQQSQLTNPSLLTT